MCSLAVVPAESWGTQGPQCHVAAATRFVWEAGRMKTVNFVSSHRVPSGRIIFLRCSSHRRRGLAPDHRVSDALCFPDLKPPRCRQGDREGERTSICIRVQRFSPAAAAVPARCAFTWGREAGNMTVVSVTLSRGE